MSIIFRIFVSVAMLVDFGSLEVRFLPRSFFGIHVLHVGYEGLRCVDPRPFADMALRTGYSNMRAAEEAGCIPSSCRAIHHRSLYFLIFISNVHGSKRGFLGSALLDGLDNCHKSHSVVYLCWLQCRDIGSRRQSLGEKSRSSQRRGGIGDLSRWCNADVLEDGDK